MLKARLTRSLTEGVGAGKSEPPRTSTKGVYGLKSCHEGSDAVADIIFVHGLAGNRETTWTDKSTGIFWPAHFLKNTLPNTRILTFGYDADLAHFWSVASQNCVRNHATNLTNAVAQLRGRTKTEERPIIFVTHSLGGLVFEDAMISSRNSPEPHLQKVYNSTVGVCFLGTPHCGATKANWATVFAQMSSTVKKINTDMLRLLEPESEVLARIQGDFQAMLRSRADQGRPQLAITCFYEELPVKGVGVIVPMHSAILPAYTSIGIHANHMDMVRFSDEKDPRYLSISDELLRWVDEIHTRHMPAASSSWIGPAAAAEAQPSQAAAGGARDAWQDSGGTGQWAPYRANNNGPQAPNPRPSPSPCWDNSPGAQSPSPSPWWENSAGAQNPSMSPWTPEPAPVSGGQWPNTLYPPSGQGYYQSPRPTSGQGYHQYPANAMVAHHPPPQISHSPTHQVQRALPPPEWQQNSHSPSASPGPQPVHQQGNIISGPIYGNGKIMQGTFQGPVTLN